jgi:mono/diheme cytochrome c family protein
MNREREKIMTNLNTLFLLAAFLLNAGVALADEVAIERGRYLVTLGGCGDCHTPGYFLGQPDGARHLGGSDVGFEVPGLGTFYGPNLTPDAETGLGEWSAAEIVTALRTGVRPDGRILAPVMPWRGFAALTDEDADAVAAYLKSIPPVRNRVAGPFVPDEPTGGLVMRIGHN